MSLAGAPARTLLLVAALAPIGSGCAPDAPGRRLAAPDRARTLVAAFRAEDCEGQLLLVGEAMRPALRDGIAFGGVVVLGNADDSLRLSASARAIGAGPVRAAGAPARALVQAAGPVALPAFIWLDAGGRTRGAIAFPTTRAGRDTLRQALQLAAAALAGRAPPSAPPPPVLHPPTTPSASVHRSP